MTSIPIVWRKDGEAPPEWVLFEMQGELQYKGTVGLVDKKGVATASSNVTTFEGLEMGILSPSSEHGPTKPELRIGNLVVPGKLVKLPKPILVLTSQRLSSNEENGKTTQGEKKRKRVDEGSDDDQASKKNCSEGAPISPSPTPGSFPSSILQTVAVIRHKYVFAQRPFSICEISTQSAPTTATASKTEKTTKPH